MRSLLLCAPPTSLNPPQAAALELLYMYMYSTVLARAVASMGQGGAIAPPILGVAPPIGSCPGHSLKPAFGNGAIAS